MSYTFCCHFTGYLTPAIQNWQMSMLALWVLAYFYLAAHMESIPTLAQNSPAKNSVFEQGENE